MKDNSKLKILAKDRSHWDSGPPSQRAAIAKVHHHKGPPSQRAKNGPHGEYDLASCSHRSSVP